MQADAVPARTDASASFRTVTNVTVRTTAKAWLELSSEAESLDLQISRSPMRSIDPQPWRSYKSGLRGGYLDVALRQGQVTCLRARARNELGVGPWGFHHCVTRLLNDSLLATRHRGRLVKAAAFPDGKAVVLRKKAKLAVARVPEGSSTTLAMVRCNSRRDLRPAVYFKGRRPKMLVSGGLRWPEGRVDLISRELRGSGTLMVATQKDVFPQKVCPVGGVAIVPPWFFLWRDHPYAEWDYDNHRPGPDPS